MSRKEVRLVSSQKMNIVRTLPARTSPSMEAINASR
jgi:hypothetical protein